MADIHPQIRCYLPLTAALAQQLQEEGSLPGELVAFIVTDSVRRSDPDGDDDAWEYAALQDAAAYCLTQEQPVLVAAADVGQDLIDDTEPTGSQVVVRGTVTLPRVASLHVGDHLVVDDSPASVVENVLELSWYDATELADVRALL